MSTQSLAGSPPSRSESTAKTNSEPTELPLDEVFDLLSNERRRQVLRYLLASPESTTLGDLAEHIASIENGKPQDALSSTERKRVYICLYQCHLSKMDDAGVIDFDEDRKTVEIGENAEQVVKFLPDEPDAEATGIPSGVTTALQGFARTVGGQLRKTLAPVRIR